MIVSFVTRVTVYYLLSRQRWKNDSQGDWSSSSLEDVTTLLNPPGVPPLGSW